MNNQTTSNEIFILTALLDHFKGDRISDERLLAFVKENRPAIDTKLWLITKNLHERHLINTNHINEHQITESGEKYLKDEATNAQSFEMAKKTVTLTRTNTTWVIVAAIAAILGLLLAIYSICH